MIKKTCINRLVKILETVMKPSRLDRFYTAYKQSTGFHLRIVVLNKSKSQMFLKSFGRLFHITDPNT